MSLASYLHSAKYSIIGFSGKCGTGKNYLAEVVLPRVLGYNRQTAAYTIEYMAFADHMKIEMGARNPALAYRDLYETKTSEVRRQMQLYGTENGRGRYGDGIWIRAMELWMEVKAHRSSCPVLFVITDVRFKNEADWVVSKGGRLIRIEAPGRNMKRLIQEHGGDGEALERARGHASETDLDDYSFEQQVVLNDEGTNPFVLHTLIKDAVVSWLEKKPAFTARLLRSCSLCSLEEYQGHHC